MNRFVDEHKQEDVNVTAELKFGVTLLYFNYPYQSAVYLKYTSGILLEYTRSTFEV